MTTRKTVSAKARTASKAKAPVRRVRNAAAKVETLNVSAPKNDFRQVVKTYLADLGKAEQGGTAVAAFMWNSLKDINRADLFVLADMSKEKAKEEGRNGERVNTFRADFYQAYKEEGRTNPRTQWNNIWRIYVAGIADGKRDPETGKAIRVKAKRGTKATKAFGNARPDRERLGAQLEAALLWTAKRGKDLDPKVKGVRAYMEKAFIELGYDLKKIKV